MGVWGLKQSNTNNKTTVFHSQRAMPVARILGLPTDRRLFAFSCAPMLAGGTTPLQYTPTNHKVVSVVALMDRQDEAAPGIQVGREVGREDIFTADSRFVYPCVTLAWKFYFFIFSFFYFKSDVARLRFQLPTYSE